jgi:hypothetical protein
LPRIEAIVVEEEEVVVPTLVVVAVARSPTVIKEETVIVVPPENAVLSTCLESEFVSSYDSRRGADWVDRRGSINTNIAIGVVGCSSSIRKTLSCSTASSTS